MVTGSALRAGGYDDDDDEYDYNYDYDHIYNTYSNIACIAVFTTTYTSAYSAGGVVASPGVLRITHPSTTCRG
jgi:hypothetical protein